MNGKHKVAAIFLMLFSQISFATHYQFIGGGENDDFDNPVNWLNDVVPADTLSRNDTITLLSAQTCIISEELTIDGILVVNGLFIMENSILNYGLILIRNGGTIDIKVGKTIRNNSTFSMNSGSKLICDGNFINFRNATINARLEGNGSLLNYNSMIFSSGTNISAKLSLSNRGTMEINCEFPVDIGKLFTNNGFIEVNSSMVVNGFLINRYELNISPSSELINNGNFQNFGRISNFDEIHNNGTFDNFEKIVNLGQFKNNENSIFSNRELARFDNRSGAFLIISPLSEFLQEPYSHLIIRD